VLDGVEIPTGRGNFGELLSDPWKSIGSLVSAAVYAATGIVQSSITA